MIARFIVFTKKFDKNLWVLSAGWFVSALGFALSIPFIAIYFNARLGLTITEVGVFFGVMAIVRAIFQGIGGELSDRIDRRSILIFAQAARSVSLLMIAISIGLDWGFWAVAGFLVVSSIFGAVFQPIANAMVSDILPEHLRLDGYAITRSAMNLGWAVGPALGGLMASKSYAALFIAASIVTLIASLLFLFFLKPVPYERAKDKFKFKDIIALKNDRTFLTHSVLTFILFIVVAQLIAPFSVYAVQIVGLSELELGYLFAANGLLVGFCQLPVTRLLSGIKMTTQLAIGAVLYAIGYTLVGAVNGFWFLMMALVVVTLGELAISPPSITLASRLAPKGKMGRYMGVYGFMMASGWSFGPLYGGIILDKLAFNSPLLAWAAISSLAIVAAVGYLMFQRKISDDINRPRIS